MNLELKTAKLRHWPSAGLDDWTEPVVCAGTEALTLILKKNLSNDDECLSLCVAL